MKGQPFTRFFLARLVLGSNLLLGGNPREELAEAAELDRLVEHLGYEGVLIEFGRMLRPAFQRGHFGNLPAVDIVGLNIEQESKAYLLWIHVPGMFHVTIRQRRKLRPEVAEALEWLGDPDLPLSIRAGALLGDWLTYDQRRELGRIQATH